MSSPFLPSSFSYNDAPQGGSLMPMILAPRDPSDTIDKQYAAGYLWLSSLDLRDSAGNTGSGTLFVQAGNQAGLPNWSALSPGAGGPLVSLSNGSTTVLPSVAGNIALVGFNSNQIVVTSSVPTHELIFSIPNVFIAPGSIEATTSLESGTTLMVGTDATIGNDLTVVNDATVGGNLTVTGTISLSGLAVNGTVTVNTVGAGTTTIGNAAAGAITVDVGTGNFAINGGGNTIDIGSDAAANHITIGTTNSTAGLILQSGDDDILLTGSVAGEIILGSISQTGLITIGRSTAGQNIDIGSAANVSAQVIDIANGASAAASTVRILSGTGIASTATLLMGSNPRLTVASLVDVAPAASRTITVGGGTVVTAVTDTIDIGPDGATTNAGASKVVNVNTGGVTLGSVLTNIASGAVTSGTHTTAIASGNRAAGTMALNLMTGTGTKIANLGNADALTTFNIDAITLINDSVNANTSINTGTSTGAVAIGNALAGAMTIDTAAGISLDAVTASNFTVTGAADLTLRSTLGSVIVSSDRDAARAIYLHANGGTSETIQIHSDLGTGVGSVNLLSDVGGITFTATGLASADAINLEAVAGGIDVNGALEINIDSSQAAATALTLKASNLAGGITMTAGTGGILPTTTGKFTVVSTDNATQSIELHANGGVTETVRIRADQGTSTTSIDVLSDVGGITLSAGLAAGNAITITSLAANGGIDLTTGGGSIDLSSAGLVTMVANAASVASPTASSTQNFNVGAATFTGFTTASSGTQTFTITNNLVSATSQLFVSIANEGANDARMQIQRVKRLAGSFEVYTINAGAAALNGNATITWWLIG